MSLIILPQNVAKDAVLVEQKAGTTSTIAGEVTANIDVNGSPVSVANPVPSEIVTGGAIISDSNRMPTEDFFHDVAEGKIAGHSLVHKFGKNDSISATWVPMAVGGVYQTPQVAAATALRIKAGGNANDTAAGTGAREITLECMDITGVITTVALATAGASASAATPSTAIRVVRAYVSASGTYATSAAGSAAGDIVIENAAGGTDWLTIDAGTFARSQSQIAVYTVPLGFTAYVYTYTLTTDSLKPVDFIFFKRGGILETAAPYSAMRTVIEHLGIEGHFIGTFKGGQKFTELTDIGWLVQGATTPEATVDFEILLVAN